MVSSAPNWLAPVSEAMGLGMKLSKLIDPTAARLSAKFGVFFGTLDANTEANLFDEALEISALKVDQVLAFKVNCWRTQRTFGAFCRQTGQSEYPPI